MGKFKRFVDLVNVSQITNTVKSKMDDRINQLVSEVQSGNLNPDNLESYIEPYEKKFEELEKASNAASIASTAIKAFKDPMGAAQDLAIQGLREVVANSEVVQNLEREAMNKIGEKLSEIPQVADAKAKIDEYADKAKDISIPEGPGIEPELPSPEALVAAAIRESGLARKLLNVE